MKGKIMERVKECPRKISRICGLTEENSGVSVCAGTVRRLPEASGSGRKRTGLIPGGKPDPEEYGEKKKQSEIR
jgi:hypothetical protein